MLRIARLLRNRLLRNRLSGLRWHNPRSNSLFVSLARLRILARIWRLCHRDAEWFLEISDLETGSEACNGFYIMIVDYPEFSQITSWKNARIPGFHFLPTRKWKSRLANSLDDMPAVFAVVGIIFGKSDFTHLQ